ncbi:MAG: hypothetical protein ABIK43_00660 [candidate division WOR-3 bacterium]
MKTLFWVLALLMFGLLGYLLHGFIEHRKSQVEFLQYEVGPQEIAAFMIRLDSLKAAADSLVLRLESMGLLRRRVAQSHLALLRDEIAAIDRTLEMWRKSRRTTIGMDIYRQLVLLYGEASAAAKALAADTLMESGR